tara:strand:- start:443 stop:703 length:261 start_codon:yes stop_codon:yes gene_type:complete
MPITKSAKKRVRQVRTRTERNKKTLLDIKKSLKELNQALEKKDKKKTMELFKNCQKVISIARNKGIFNKSKASRKISALNRKIKAN